MIRNIETRWNFERMDSYPELMPGRREVQSFPIYDGTHFYGQVSLSFENAKGQRFKKDFIFKESELPNIGRNSFAEVLIYFTQNGAYYYTSDHPNYQEIKMQNRNLMHEYWEDYKLRCRADLSKC